MLKLCGFQNSNYYNKVKFALLEKGIPFTEEHVKVGPWAAPGLTERTPFGKVPFIEAEAGALCESLPIMEYLEARWPTPALMPQDPWQAAKVRELVTCIELHLELTVRQLFPSLYFGAPPMSDSSKERVHKQLIKHVESFKRLVQPTPLAQGKAEYLVGNQFSQADIAAYIHLPIVGLTSKLGFGEDMLLAAGIDYKPHKQLIGARPAAIKVDNDRKAYMAASQTSSKS